MSKLEVFFCEFYEVRKRLYIHIFRSDEKGKSERDSPSFDPKLVVMETSFEPQVLEVHKKDPQ